MIVLSEFNVFTVDRAIDSKGKKMENLEKKEQTTTSRRAFLIKAAYVAPVVIGLGALTLPASAQASTFVGSIQSVPATNPATIYGTATVTGDSGPDVITGGSYTKTGSSTTTLFTAQEVKDNNIGLFSWAKQFFASIG